MYVTTTIPYVNARPHLGFALEIVQADVLARHRRGRGEPVRFQTGTDDNSLKNVLAAEAEGVPVRELVDRNAAAFEALREPLELSFDAFVRTSRHPGHRAGVERIWKAVSHDLYRRSYEGLYCVGCEQFYPEGPCPEGHEAPLQRVAEENWFFRLSRYGERLIDLVESGRLRVEPAARRNEVLAFLRGGLEDLSVSRSAARARGWGIPVPGDPGQVVYVWWDALANYVTALEDDYDRWWVREPRKIHLVGKGVIRFHAVYWPAMLLSAGLPLPSDIVVHDYLTAGGRKISKSSGVTVDPVALVRAYGVDAVRWWLLREVPRVGDADFTEERLVARADEDLANGVGNLVNRVVTMVHRFQDGHVTDREDLPGLAGEAERTLAEVEERTGALVDEALEDFDFRRAAAAVQEIVAAANAYVERVRPWQQEPADREASLAALVAACRTLAVRLEPFLPSAAARVAAAVSGERLPAPRPLFPRLAGSDVDRLPGRA
ncbi:methionine--tRNA ligase [Nonomuraea sp. 3-1Str]|uniref:methionine--tRNA ligase n=1 Tax=Nonomuraea sp. 3-1Str TaxID=2929801 RepID=UPI0028626852|nr:methionine--tRNA ligase [Nonomuraea sp. 3-1Str]MDR8414948.1 methionine--tRNA ligase [Nonomuraea sp. 3-1Str]